jgi:hypothetical protein
MDGVAGALLNRAQNESRSSHIAYHRGFVWPVDLAAQPAHMNIDKVRFRNESVMPHVLEEGCARNQLVAPLHHVPEQTEFTWPQIDRSVTTLRGSIDEIKLQRSNAEYRLGRLD